jgi:hypothetical protein
MLVKVRQILTITQQNYHFLISDQRKMKNYQQFQTPIKFQITLSKKLPESKCGIVFANLLTKALRSFLSEMPYC